MNLLWDPDEAALCFINAHHSLHLNKYLSIYYLPNNHVTIISHQFSDQKHVKNTSDGQSRFGQ